MSNPSKKYFYTDVKNKMADKGRPEQNMLLQEASGQDSSYNSLVRRTSLARLSSLEDDPIITRHR
jgi:hypothetical protein